MNSSLFAFLFMLIASILIYRAFFHFVKTHPQIPQSPAPPPIAMLILYILLLGWVNFIATLVLLTTLVTLKTGNFSLECIATNSWILVNPACLGRYFPLALFIASIVSIITGVICFVLLRQKLTRQ